MKSRRLRNIAVFRRLFLQSIIFRNDSLLFSIYYFICQDETEEYLEYGRSPDATVPGCTPDTPMGVSPGFISSPVTHLTVQVLDVNRSRR